MSPGSIVLFAAFFGGILLVLLALMVWQQARARPSYEPLEYVIEHAVRHIAARLPEGTKLNNADIRRILEYEVYYLQGLAQEDRRNPVEAVAGGHESSIRWIGSEIQSKHDIAYSPQEIAAVLNLEADYLMAIGAVGDPVEVQGEEEQ